MLLSPLAQPFHPVIGEDPSLAIIYNDGVPSLAFQGSHSEFLHTITDDAIDEAFPPDAQEAAELEAVEIFVEMMASFALLEEREEATRFVHAGLKKRWEARRELVGRPRPPKHLVHQVIHGGPHLLDASEIVVYDHSPMMHEYRMRAREMRVAKQHMSKKRVSRGMPTRPILQPRKQN
jgi:hypothetical protein